MSALVLASASPRRRQMLEELGARFESIAAAVDETPRPGEEAQAFARRVTREKAEAVARIARGRFVLAADTVVVVDGEILGKPVDRSDAGLMLRRLSGRRHQVCTAVVLRAPDGSFPLDDVTSTSVEFRSLTDDDVEIYLDSGEAHDKAGAYGIQGAAGRFVVRIDGSYSNVVGLPLELVVPALRRAGLLED